MLYDYIIVCYVHPNSPKQQLGLFQNLAFLVVFDRKLAWNERHDGHDPRCALGALVGFWMILQVLDVPPVKGQFQLPFIYPFSHNHGSVENYPKWKETNIGDTPIFHFHEGNISFIYPP